MHKTTIGRAFGAVVVAGIVAMGGPALGDGFIVPVREGPVRGQWAVKYHRVDITVRDQVASVTVDQQFENVSGGLIEAEYFFPVPPDAAVDGLTLMVDGKEFSAKLLKADEARRIYEEIVRKKKDPALLEYVNQGLYKTSAFPLEPGKPVRVAVTYKSILKRDANVVELWYPLATEKHSAKALGEVSVRADIQAPGDIAAIYSPTHELKVDRKEAGRVIASWQAKDVLPTADFQIFYTLSDKDVGATLLTHQPVGQDGYFMLLASPKLRAGGTSSVVVAKDVIVVLDRSGSMGGAKISQAKEAVRFILNNLNQNDRFNVVAYSDSVEQFFTGLVPADKEHLDEARQRTDQITAGGGTNIYDALRAATALRGTDSSARPNYVLFLTDGLPTAGKTDDKSILEAALADGDKDSPGRPRIFAFGVGYDVNTHLLDKLVEQNSGKSQYVKPDEPIENKVSSLYAKIRNPVMTNLKVRVDWLVLTDMYPRELGDLFEGDQILAVGRYRPAEDKSPRETQLVITGQHDGSERVFEYPVKVRRGGQGGYEFVEKLWAVRRVGYLLDQIQLHGQNKELVDELVRLSRDYGIMTPYTSFLAEEKTNLASKEELRKSFDSRNSGVNEATSGGVGQVHAANRLAMRDATVAQESAAPASTVVNGGSLSAARQQGYGDTADYEAGKATAIQTVQNVGNQTLYLRGQRWVTPQTAAIDPEKDASKVQVIERFTAEYFELARLNTQVENQVLGSQMVGQELLIELRGQVYLIK